jgi:hypothetical protein
MAEYIRHTFHRERSVDNLVLDRHEDYTKTIFCGFLEAQPRGYWNVHILTIKSCRQFGICFIWRFE